MKRSLCFIFLFVCSFAFAQNKKIDSLLILLKTDAADTNKIIHLYTLCRQYTNIGEYDKGLVYGKQALALATVISSRVEKSITNPVYKAVQQGIAQSYNNIGNIYNNQGNYPAALKNYFASLKIRKEINDRKGIAWSHNNIGLIYYHQGNYPEALKNQFTALKIREEMKDKQGISASYNNIGVIYIGQGNYPEALKNYFAALKISEEMNDKQVIAESYNNIGIIYNNQGNYPEALKNHVASLKIREEIKDKRGIAGSYNNIGIVYRNQGNYLEALKNFFASLKIMEEINDKMGVASFYGNIGILYTKLNKTSEAKDYLNKALALSQEIGSNDAMKESYADLAVLDSIVGNYKAAFEHHKLYILYRDSLNNEETKKKSLQASMQYEFDKKEIATKAEQDKLDAINAEEKQKQKIVIYAVAGLLVLVGVFAVFMYNRFRITQKQKEVIEEQKVLVDKAYESLHEKNKEVMDSIRYAKRIQTALITSEKYINNTLNRLMK